MLLRFLLFTSVLTMVYSQQCTDVGKYQGYTFTADTAADYDSSITYEECQEFARTIDKNVLLYGGTTVSGATHGCSLIKRANTDIDVTWNNRTDSITKCGGRDLYCLKKKTSCDSCVPGYEPVPILDDQGAPTGGKSCTACGLKKHTNYIVKTDGPPDSDMTPYDCLMYAYSSGREYERPVADPSLPAGCVVHKTLPSVYFNVQLETSSGPVSHQNCGNGFNCVEKFGCANCGDKFIDGCKEYNDIIVDKTGYPDGSVSKDQCEILGAVVINNANRPSGCYKREDREVVWNDNVNDLKCDSSGSQLYHAKDTECIKHKLTDRETCPVGFNGAVSPISLNSNGIADHSVTLLECHKYAMDRNIPFRATHVAWSSFRPFGCFIRYQSSTKITPAEVVFNFLASAYGNGCSSASYIDDTKCVQKKCTHCAAGYGGSDCSRCISSQYSKGGPVGTAACSDKTCLVGTGITNSDVSISGGCVPCNSGEISAGGVNQCQQCPSNAYSGKPLVKWVKRANRYCWVSDPDWASRYYDAARDDGGTIEECKNRCWNDPKCAGVTYRYDNKRCIQCTAVKIYHSSSSYESWIKEADYPNRPTPTSWVSKGDQVCSDSPTWSKDYFDSRWPGDNSEGYGGGSRPTVNTLEECKAQCWNVPSCTGVSYRPENKRCVFCTSPTAGFVPSTVSNAYQSAAKVVPPLTCNTCLDGFENSDNDLTTRCALKCGHYLTITGTYDPTITYDMCKDYAKSLNTIVKGVSWSGATLGCTGWKNTNNDAEVFWNERSDGSAACNTLQLECLKIGKSCDCAPGASCEPCGDNEHRDYVVKTSGMPDSSVSASECLDLGLSGGWEYQRAIYEPTLPYGCIKLSAAKAVYFNVFQSDKSCSSNSAFECISKGACKNCTANGVYTVANGCKDYTDVVLDENGSPDSSVTRDVCLNMGANTPVDFDSRPSGCYSRITETPFSVEIVWNDNDNDIGCNSSNNITNSTGGDSKCVKLDDSTRANCPAGHGGASFAKLNGNGKSDNSITVSECLSYARDVNLKFERVETLVSSRPFGCYRRGNVEVIFNTHIAAKENPCNSGNNETECVQKACPVCLAGYGGATCSLCAISEYNAVLSSVGTLCSNKTCPLGHGAPKLSEWSVDQVDQEANDCVPCPSGEFSPAADEGQCRICPSGTYSSLGSSSCTPCPDGYEDHDNDPSSVCVKVEEEEEGGLSSLVVSLIVGGVSLLVGGGIVWAICASRNKKRTKDSAPIPTYSRVSRIDF